MIITTRAIVLNNIRYGDNSLIVDLYTEKTGRQTVFVKGVFSKKSTVRPALFQSLNMLEIDLYHRANREMQRISNIQMYYPFHNIPYEPVKNCIALFIAEILYKTLKEEEANVDLFEFLIHTIQTLDFNEYGTANFHLAFLVHLSRYLGFYVKYDNLSPQLSEISFDSLNRIELNHNQRNILTEYMLDYYSTHVDNFGKVKSFQVLQNVFQN
jgi:DNA repair protein RecO (recombination protein O)